MQKSKAPKTRDGLASPCLKRMRQMQINELKAKHRQLVSEFEAVCRRLRRVQPWNPMPQRRHKRLKAQADHLRILLDEASELIANRQKAA